MKKIGITIMVSIISSVTFAFDYPELSDPIQQKFLNLYLSDRNDLYKEDFFSPLKTEQEWSCRISRNEQYKLANLLLSKPLVIENELNTQKKSDNTSQDETTITNSNVRIIPMKVECVNGKIMGEVKLRIEYDSLLDQYLKNSPNQTRVISKIHNITLSSGNIKDGALIGTAKSFTKLITQLKIESSQNEEKKEFSNPIITLQMNYKDDIGNTALFSEETDFYLTGGQIKNLKSAFVEIIDKNHTRKTTYKNNYLSMIEPYKNGIPHGDQLGYLVGMDDKIDLIEAALPSSHPKLVTINGINYLETHLCVLEGVEVDQFPCLTDDQNKVHP